jgi:DNA-binding NarL/FixJ family response regulator
MVRGRKILIIEDDVLIGIANEAILSDAGYEVVGLARTAAEAVTVAALKKPDLLIVDVNLSAGGTGIDAATRIHAELGIRSVFATANVDPQTVAKATPARPLGWVPKPYSRERLLKAVAQALNVLNDGEAPR